MLEFQQRYALLMQCTLFIPHLLSGRDFINEACRDLRLDSLRKFLARARRTAFGTIGTEAWLCQAFEVEQQLDWPVAPLTLVADGGDAVHLHANRGQLVLACAGNPWITRQEADDLVAALNRHFADDGLHFLAPHPERWYLRLAHRPGISTHPPEAVAGADINAFLPQGKDALHWHKVFNEIQMLLHAHPVNEARDARGEPLINSVWLWGGGSKTAVRGRHFCAAWGNNVLAAALAAGADIHAAALPAGADEWLRAADTRPSPAHHLILHEEFARAMQQGDLAAWRRAALALEQHWIAPLLTALWQKRIAAIALVAPGPASCLRFELDRLDLLRVWRASAPLSAHATN
jgi:hypothetical protein